MPERLDNSFIIIKFEDMIFDQDKWGPQFDESPLQITNRNFLGVLSV